MMPRAFFPLEKWLLYAVEIGVNMIHITIKIKIKIKDHINSSYAIVS